MIRRLYLATLVFLQFALVVHLAPPLAQSLRIGGALALIPGDGFALAYLFTMALAATGVSIALAFPVIALARHRRRGALRFFGLPRWPVALAVAGSVAFACAMFALWAVPLLAPDSTAAVLALVRAGTTAGIALMASGVLAAELLRRSVAPPRSVARTVRSAERLEVTYPPELRTRAA
jgi:hypothetical protein